MHFGIDYFWILKYQLRLSYVFPTVLHDCICPASVSIVRATPYVASTNCNRNELFSTHLNKCPIALLIKSKLLQPFAVSHKELFVFLPCKPRLIVHWTRFCPWHPRIIWIARFEKILCRSLDIILGNFILSILYSILS